MQPLSLKVDSNTYPLLLKASIYNMQSPCVTLSLLPLPIPSLDPSIEPLSLVNVNMEDDDQGNKLGHDD